MRGEFVYVIYRLDLGMTSSDFYSYKGSSINYVIADRGGGVSPKDYSIT